MLITQKIKLKWNNRIVTWYQNKGYRFTHIGDEFEVSVDDLTARSSAEVKCACDYCGKTITTSYADHMESRKITPKDCCISCTGQKMSESKARLKRSYQDIYDILNEGRDEDKIIPLGDEDFAYVDIEDYERVSKYRWHLKTSGYAVANVKQGDGTYKQVPMHRFIMKAPDDYEIDHRDNDKLNNRRSNLRECTRSENGRNIPAYNKEMKSKYKGVSYHKAREAWYARITVDNKIKTLGYFFDEVACANIYNHYAKEYFGEFAWLNDVPYMSKEECDKYRRIDKRRKENKPNQ